MRTLVPLMAALIVAVAAGLLASSPADAHGRRGNVGVWFNFGVPYYYPAPVYYYPYPRYSYPYPAYVPPPQYVEQNAPSPQPGPPASGAPSQGGSGYYWYYCPDSQTYYPYVQSCASQWQQVTPGSGPPS